MFSSKHFVKPFYFWKQIKNPNFHPAKKDKKFGINLWTNEFMAKILAHNFTEACEILEKKYGIEFGGNIVLTMQMPDETIKDSKTYWFY